MLFELWVMSAVTVLMPPGVIGFGDALIWSTIHGSASTVPLPLLKMPLAVPEHPARPRQARNCNPTSYSRRRAFRLRRR